jgi:hypothetical protein
MQHKTFRRGKATHHHSMVQIALRARSGLMRNRRSIKTKHWEIR